MRTLNLIEAKYSSQIELVSSQLELVCVVTAKDLNIDVSNSHKIIPELN